LFVQILRCQPLFLMTMAWNFSLLANRKLSEYQLAATCAWSFNIAFTSLIWTPDEYNWWSSAYVDNWQLLIEKNKSFWKIFQRSDPKQDPLGHPFLIFCNVTCFIIILLKGWKHNCLMSNFRPFFILVKTAWNLHVTMTFIHRTLLRDFFTDFWFVFDKK